MRPFLRPRKLWELTESAWSSQLDESVAKLIEVIFFAKNSKHKLIFFSIIFKECDPNVALLNSGSFQLDCFPFDGWKSVIDNQGKTNYLVRFCENIVSKKHIVCNNFSISIIFEIIIYSPFFFLNFLQVRYMHRPCE